MNAKSLFLGLAVAASLISTAQANLVLNGSLERGDTFNSTYVNGYPLGGIPNWTVQGAPLNLGVFNAVYIYDDFTDASLPIYMPPAYYSCAPALGFISGNASCVNPDGPGHFINLDGDPAFPAAISQSISGLVANHQYRLSFYWAVVQRNDQSGPITNNYLDVSLGTSLVESTTPLNLPAQGFSGWLTTTYDFTWSGVNNGVDNMLIFLAHGAPTNLPPSINLDGISLNAIPEPPTLILLIFGLVGVFALRRRQVLVVA